MEAPRLAHTMSSPTSPCEEVIKNLSLEAIQLCDRDGKSGLGRANPCRRKMLLPSWMLMQINPRGVWSFVIPPVFVGASVPHPSRRHLPAIENKREKEKLAPCWREGRETRRSLSHALRCSAFTPGRACCTTLPLPGMDAGVDSGRGNEENQSRRRRESGSRDGVVALVCCGFFLLSVVSKLLCVVRQFLCLKYTDKSAGWRGLTAKLGAGGSYER